MLLREYASTEVTCGLRIHLNPVGSDGHFAPVKGNLVP